MEAILLERNLERISTECKPGISRVLIPGVTDG